MLTMTVENTRKTSNEGDNSCADTDLKVFMSDGLSSDYLRCGLQFYVGPNCPTIRGPWWAAKLVYE